MTNTVVSILSPRLFPRHPRYCVLRSCQNTSLGLLQRNITNAHTRDTQHILWAGRCLPVLVQPNHEAGIRQCAEAAGGSGGDTCTNVHGHHAVKQHDESFYYHHGLVRLSHRYQRRGSLGSVRWPWLDWSHSLRSTVYLHGFEPLLFPMFVVCGVIVLAGLDSDRMLQTSNAAVGQMWACGQGRDQYLGRNCNA